ncbi:MAG: hypothetical protein M1826_006213 [Phylliscum demangeonii]|nr:MAG: hypothetical protein M1826_006213 [Phylliscum demangeonii]
MVTGRKAGKPNDQNILDCLGVLEKKPQWWTSYSNARQNAMVICQAVRSEIEKDELIDLHASMTEVISNLSMSLSYALDQSTVYLRDQKSFADTVHILQSEVRDEMSKISEDSRRTTVKLADNLESTLQRVHAQMSSTAHEVEAQYDNLKDHIRRSGNSMQEDVSRILHELFRASSELVSKQTQEMELNHEVAAQIGSSLRLIREQGMQGMAIGLNGLERQLEVSMRNVANLNGIYNVMHQVGALMELGKSLTVLSEAQAVLHKSFKEHMLLAAQFIEQVSTSTLNLQAVVDDATAKVKDLGIHSIAESISYGFHALFKLALVAMIASYVDRRAAVRVVVLAVVVSIAQYSQLMPTVLSTVAELKNALEDGSPHVTIEVKPATLMIVAFVLSASVLIIGGVLLWKWLGRSISKEHASVEQGPEPEMDGQAPDSETDSYDG